MIFIEHHSPDIFNNVWFQRGWQVVPRKLLVLETLIRSQNLSHESWNPVFVHFFLSQSLKSLKFQSHNFQSWRLSESWSYHSSPLYPYPSCGRLVDGTLPPPSPKHWIYKLASYFLLKTPFPLQIPNHLPLSGYEYFQEPGYRTLIKVFWSPGKVLDFLLQKGTCTLFYCTISQLNPHKAFVFVFTFGILQGRQGVLMVSGLDSESSGPGRGHWVVAVLGQGTLLL